MNIIERVEISESLYNELITMNELNKKSLEYKNLFGGVAIVLNKGLEKGYKIIYKK